MRIATFNVNSIRSRLEIVQNFIDEFDIDVLCMQEIKVENDKFPLKAVKKFSEIEQMRYDFLIKLFGTELDKSFIKGKYGNRFYFKLLKEILFFKTINAIKEEDDRFILTEKGLYLWVVMMREFFIGVNNFRDYCRGIVTRDS